MALTVVHHLYGAWRYATPWRHHVALIVLPIFAVFFVLYAVERLRRQTREGEIARRAFCIVSAVVAVCWIGLFEGAYGHLVKNVVYAAGVSEATFARYFPPPAYEVPDDLLFEGTGIAQVVLGLLAGYCLLRYWRDRGGRKLT